MLEVLKQLSASEDKEYADEWSPEERQVFECAEKEIKSIPSFCGIEHTYFNPTTINLFGCILNLFT